jgi:hypothetical protein
MLELNAIKNLGRKINNVGESNAFFKSHYCQRYDRLVPGIIHKSMLGIFCRRQKRGLFSPVFAFLKEHSGTK